MQHAVAHAKLTRAHESQRERGGERIVTTRAKRAKALSNTKYTLYVISNSRGTTYVGITSNVERRLKAHRAGRVISTGRGCKDWQLLRTWGMRDYIDASKFERFLHRMTKRKVLEIVEEEVISTELCAAYSALPTTAYELARLRE